MPKLQLLRLPYLMFGLVALLSGCAGVKTVSIDTADYISLRRGDILTTGELSASSYAALQVIGLSDRSCQKHPTACRDRLKHSIGLGNEQRMATLAELWLQHALESKNATGNTSTLLKQQLDAYLEAARYAYAYLFFTERTPQSRALEDRQTQVRDYYNFAVQQAVTGMFNHYHSDFVDSLDEYKRFHTQTQSWAISGSLKRLRLAHNQALPSELIPAASLTFKGMRNQYRRDGLGAELVAVMAKKVVGGQSAQQSFSETPFPALTVILRFPGKNLAQVLATQEVELLGFDPYRTDQVELAQQTVPLAANFTSGYGLWLARSGFASQSLLTLIGRGEVLEQPHIYLMQPYDPERRIILLLHGLASSPEAWINVANEMLGDETLRKNYQIWQLYYPTNAPIALNQHTIRQTLQQTLSFFDPTNLHPATQDIILIGHSMGGVLARLMVSSSGDQLWDKIVQHYELNGARKLRAQEVLKNYAWFEPVPQVQRAIFIAAPHRGTPIAENRLARWSARLVKLPFSMLGRVTEIAQILVDPSSAQAAPITRSFNSIDNLSDQAPFIRMTAGLPISSNVAYHSIIGHEKLKIPLLDSSDGVVPYRSAHLENAASEKVIHSWHSVQENPAAIIEVRRILHEHLLPAESGRKEEVIENNWTF